MIEETHELISEFYSLTHSESLKGVARALYTSKITKAPLDILTYKVDRILGRVDSNPAHDCLKMYVHEAHETQLLAMLGMLKPSSVDRFVSVEPSSQLQIELLYSESCLSSAELDKEQCFNVQMILNGKFLEFEGACADPVMCTYPEFAAYREQISYSGPYSDDLIKACNTLQI